MIGSAPVRVARMANLNVETAISNDHHHGNAKLEGEK